MDPIQLVIVAATTALTVVFVALGVQMWHILGEVRKSIQKMNKMLDDMGKVTGTVGEGVSNLSGFINGLRTGFSMIHSIRGKGEKDE